MLSPGKVNLAKVQDDPKTWVIVILAIFFPPACYWYLGQIKKGFIMWGVGSGIMFAVYVPMFMAIFTIGESNPEAIGWTALFTYIALAVVNVALRVWFFMDCRNIVRMKKNQGASPA